MWFEQRQTFDEYCLSHIIMRSICVGATLCGRPSVCKYWKLHLDFYGNMSYNIFVDIFRQGEISLRWFHRRFRALHTFLIHLATLMWRQVQNFFGLHLTLPRFFICRICFYIYPSLWKERMLMIHKHCNYAQKIGSSHSHNHCDYNSLHYKGAVKAQ